MIIESRTHDQNSEAKRGQKTEREDAQNVWTRRGNVVEREERKQVSRAVSAEEEKHRARKCGVRGKSEVQQGARGEKMRAEAGRVGEQGQQ